MIVVAWTVAVISTVVYGLLVLTSTGAAQAFGPVFVILVLGSWGYLTTRHERNRNGARRPR